MRNCIPAAKKGLSVVEVMVAIAIFTTVSLVGYQVFVEITEVLQKQSLEHQAIWLAKEGIELAQSISRDDFENLDVGEWGRDLTNGQWELTANPVLVNDTFSPTLVIQEEDDDHVIVSSNVSWEFKDITYSKSLQIELTNWQEENDSERLIVDTSGIYLFMGTNLLGIEVSAVGEDDVTIDSISMTWSKNARQLTSIQTPAFNYVFLGSADSSEVIDMSDFTVSQNDERDIVFTFNRNMNNTDFSLTFIFSDGDSQTVEFDI